MTAVEAPALPSRPLRPEPAPARVRPGGPLAVVVAGLGLWALGCATVVPRDADGWGLAAVLPWTVWAGLALTAGALAWSVWWRYPGRVLTAVLGVLIFQLYGLQPLVERLPRTTTVWLHLGFIDQYATSGTDVAGVDARFSWPGFFAWWGMVTGASGERQLTQLANWWPLGVALITAALTWRLARLLGTSERAAWFAAVLVSVANWIEQDYFSPQSTTFVLAFGVLVLLLAAPAQRPRERAAGVVLVVVSILAIVVSHQLTPVLIGLQLLALLVTRHRVRSVLLVLAAAELSWFVLGAHEFWSGPGLRLLTDGLGNVGATFGINLTQRIGSADPGLLAVREMRVGYFAAMLLLGCAGLLLRRRARRPVLLPALLVAVPVAAVVQGYGGEMFMRLALFALPTLAVLGGETLDRLGDLRPRAVLVPVLLVAAGACTVVVIRGGNDGFSYVTEDEVRTVRAAITATPRNGLLLLAEEQGPVRTARVSSIRWENLPSLCGPDVTLAACATAQRADTVLVTRGMIRWGVLGEGRPADWAREQVDALVTGGDYTVLTDNRDGTVLVRTGKAATK